MTQEVIEKLNRIKNLCETPYWTNNRRSRILDLTNEILKLVSPRIPAPPGKKEGVT